MDYKKEREEVASFMRRLYRQFLTTTSGGNISFRAADGNIVITASQSDKGEQSPENVGVVTPDGTSLTPHLKLSIETGMHLTAEAYAVAGETVMIPYALMGSEALAANVAEKMRDHDCGLMENHGVITLGKTLLQAFDRMELLECAAKQTVMSQLIPCRSLTKERLEELDRFVGR